MRFSQLVWSYITLFTAWLVLRLLFFDRFWWLALINTVALYLFAPLLILFPVALWRQQWRLLAGLSLPLGLFIAFYGALFMPPAPFVISPNSPSLTVMTFNMLWSNTDYDAIERLLDSTMPDLVGLQEVQTEAAPILVQRFSDLYPYYFFHPVDRFHNVGVLSRFPLQSSAVLPELPFQRGLQVTIQPEGRPLQIIVAHLTPNYPISQVLQLAQSWYDQRATQVEYLRQIVAQRQRPTVVLCDCNFTDTSQAYSTTKGFLRDSFREAGWGLGHTMKGPLFPTSRLDYIWYSPELQAVKAAVSLDASSDHLPLLVQLQWK